MHTNVQHYSSLSKMKTGIGLRNRLVKRLHLTGCPVLATMADERRSDKLGGKPDGMTKS